MIEICAPVPVTFTGTAIVIPVIVAQLDVTSELSGAWVTFVKLNALGVASPLSV